jgi:hypothetical protein
MSRTPGIDDHLRQLILVDRQVGLPAAFTGGLLTSALTAT